MEGERERWREGGSARLHVRRNEIRAEGERVREGRREVDIRKVCSSRKAGDIHEYIIYTCTFSTHVCTLSTHLWIHISYMNASTRQYIRFCRIMCRRMIHLHFC